jgi:hypothetical protein
MKMTRGWGAKNRHRGAGIVLGAVGMLLALSACAPSGASTGSGGSGHQGGSTTGNSAAGGGSSTAAQPSPTSSPSTGIDLDADGSWQLACVLTPAQVNSILAPAGITVNSTEPGSTTDNADCSYMGANSAGGSDFQLAAYDPTQTYGFLTSGTPAADWVAPNPAQGYANACKAAQANGGAQCIPTIGRGLVVGDTYNQAVLFVDGPAFFSLNILYFNGNTAAATTYIALAKSVAATGPIK